MAKKANRAEEEEEKTEKETEEEEEEDEVVGHGSIGSWNGGEGGGGLLDIGRMREAAKLLEGTHDFTAFCGGGKQCCRGGRDHVRTVLSVNVDSDSMRHRCAAAVDDAAGGGGGLIYLDVIGKGFLTHMVRLFAAALVRVGQRRMGVGELKRILDERNRRAVGGAAQAKGLCLMRVEYESTE